MTNAVYQPIGRVSYSQGLRLGLPRNPKSGQAVQDTKTGVVYVWMGEEGLGDLGFWGALISAMAGPILGGIFGGPKSDESARKAMQQQQQEIEALNQRISQQGFFDKKTIFLVALLGLGLVFAFK